MTRIRAFACAVASTGLFAIASAHADGPPQMRRTATVDAYAYTPPPEGGVSL